MVLDEDALEAMLKRQKDDAEEGEAKESKQVELKEQTEEFEVYERPGAESATGPGIRAATADEDEPDHGIVPETSDQVLPDAFQDDTQVDKTAAPASEPEPEPEQVPEPEPTPTPEPTPEPEPQAAPTPEPTREPGPEAKAEAPEEEDEAPVRPRVWPPLSRKDDAPAPQAPVQESVPEPEPETEEEPEPESKPAPAPEPEPQAAPTPEPTPAQTSESQEDPHAHAHADLDVDGGGVRVAIVQALFNQDITDMMADLAASKARKRGAKVTHHVTVPGVYDLPLVTARLLERDDVDCAVVIGVVVQGETAHDDLITHATARTLQQLSLDVDKPIGLGITGPGMTWKQAEARVANGAHALDAALAQVELLKGV